MVSPSVGGDEPRYDGIEAIQRPFVPPNVSISNSHENGVQPNGSSDTLRTSQNLPSSSRRFNQGGDVENFLVGEENMEPTGDSIISTRLPFIEPPKGFEHETDDAPSNNKNNQTKIINRDLSRDSSVASCAEDIPTRPHRTQVNGSNIVSDNSPSDLEVTGHTSEQPTSGQNRDGHDAALVASTSGGHPHSLDHASTNLRSATNKTEPQPSSYSSLLKSGFNIIKSRITNAFANTPDRCLQDDVPRFAFGHKPSLKKTWRLMDKVVECCQRPRMNLNNSPPFMLEILPETYQHLKLIYTKYSSNHPCPTNDNEYSQIFLRNIQNRCKQTLRLFKDAKEEMFNTESEYRQKLTRNTLVFNHILSELKAIFPDGLFIGERYLITKETAGEFWKANFSSSVLVDWRTFYHALQGVHNIDSTFFSLHALKQTIDLTCDDYISIFEFDVFTRLFQPWSTLLINWQILAVTHPGYKAFLTYDELKARLQKHIDKPGSYVFRLSCTRLGQWAIGYVTPKGEILQTIVQNISLSQALTETGAYLYPDGKNEDPDLSLLCSGMVDDRNVTVTEEQYEIYCGVGNSFQTCKICFENDKDIRVEPCNHLLCTSCLLAWQESEGQGCPYCRTEIKEAVKITMDLPDQSSSR